MVFGSFKLMAGFVLMGTQYSSTRCKRFFRRLFVPNVDVVIAAVTSGCGRLGSSLLLFCFACRHRFQAIINKNLLIFIINILFYEHSTRMPEMKYSVAM